MQTLDPDSRLGAYRIVRLLGKGGMAAVYEAIHVQLGTRVALKVFATEDAANLAFKRKRFLAEGKVLARLHHPRIVHVYDLAVDPDSGTPYFAMDLVLSPSGEPQTLEDARLAGVDEHRVAGWLSDLCKGLATSTGREWCTATSSSRTSSLALTDGRCSPTSEYRGYSTRGCASR